MAFALIFMFIKQMRSALLLFVLMLLLYFVIVRPAIKQYSATWREGCIRYICEKLFPSVSYSYRVKTAEHPEVTSFLMLPVSRKGRPLLHNLVTEEGTDQPAVLCDITVPVDTKSHFLTGCRIFFPAPEAVNCTLRAVKGEIMPVGLYESYLSSEQFRLFPIAEGMPDNTVLYCLSDCPQPSEAVAGALLELMKSIPGDGIAEINAQGVFVFLPHRLLDRLPPSLKHPVTEAFLREQRFPELEAAALLTGSIKKLTQQNQEAQCHDR